MVKVGISINDVVRDFLNQFEYTYSKYIGELDIEENPVTSFDLKKHFPFPSDNELNKFLYQQASLEIFGHAGQIDDMVSVINNFIIENDDDIELTLVSRDVYKAISGTLFFLSKTGSIIKNIKFVEENKDEWCDFDILITANPIALVNKPEGKISVKVETTYNENVTADHTIKSLVEFLENEEIRNTIINNKTKEINHG
jgi:hypothetical protein